MKRVASVFVFVCLFSCFSSAGATSYMAGDANADSLVNAGDVVYLLGYLFRSGPPPVFWECGDPNTDCLVNAADVVYMISYLFRQGTEPHIVECGWSEPVNLGPSINTDKGEYAISFSFDMKKLVLESNRTGTYGSSDVWYAEWDSLSGWGDLINCGPNVNTSLLDESPCLSPEGNQIYVSYWNRPGGYVGWDLWVTTWDSLAGEWSIPEHLGPNVNGDAADRTPFVTSDGSKLYFGSNRYFSGISVCEWEGDGWGEAVWLGEVVNETGTEAYPSLTADGSAMYFSRWITASIRRIYVSYWTGTDWGTPIELPAHINYPDISTRAPWITPDGSKLYFVAHQRPGGFGSTDIWVSERIPVPEGKRFINRKTSPVGKSR